MELEGKVAVVTGGGQGIGRAITGAFLRAGMKVMIAEIDPEAIREASEEIPEKESFRVFPADISNEEDVRSLFGETERHFGRLDVLVNNAGIFLKKPLTGLTLGEWSRVISVNLTGVYLCSRYAVPLLGGNKGAILNIASTRAFMSEPDTEAYSASKGGIVALTHAMAVSLGPDIRVNCISPGWIEVSAWKKKSERKQPDLSSMDRLQHPAGRVGEPEDIASLALHLVSPQASFITGANFIVDGGMTRKMIYV